MRTFSSVRAMQWLSLICLFLLAQTDICLASRTLNRGIHAAPVMTSPKIDGELKDWNRAGAFLCCRNVELLEKTESATVVAMWDKDALYLTIEWRDSTPLANPIDPVTLPGNGWRNDCLQLRFNIDGFITHLDCWYYATGKNPAASMSYGSMRRERQGKKPDRPTDPAAYGFQQAFALAADGKGYTQEMRIPWAMVTASSPADPQELKIKMGLELMWGGSGFDNFIKSRVSDNLVEGYDQTDFFWTADDYWGQVILEKTPNFTLPEPAWRTAMKNKEPQGAIGIPLTLAEDSYVTLAISDKDGNRVRCLAGGVFLPKGEQTLWWSGLDDRGRLLPEGEYRWSGLVRPALGLRYAMTFYQPNAEKPWNTGDGQGAWGPDHGKIEAIATAADGMIFLGGDSAEAGNGLFAVGPDGKKRWSVKNAAINYLTYYDGLLYGYKLGGSVDALGLADAGLMTFRAADGGWQSLTGPKGQPVLRLPLLGDDGKRVCGMAADKEHLYFALREKNEVRWFDRATLQEQGHAPVKEPRAIAAQEGEILIAAEAGLFRLTMPGGTLMPVCAANLQDARGMTITGNGKTVYVTIAGATRQVWQFERQADGFYQQTSAIGKAGGRADTGVYRPTDGFVHPSALAADAAGRLWVAEDSFHPKRVSVWQNGAWQKDYLGDSFYGGGGLINPLDPTQAVYGDMTFRIDLKSGDWRLERLGFDLPANGAEFGYQPDFFYDQHCIEEIAGKSRLIAANGKVLLYYQRGSGYPSKNGAPTNRQIYRATPVGGWQLCGLVDILGRRAWMDRNDDGLFSADEFQKIPAETADWGYGGRWGMYPSQEMDQFFSNRLEPGWRVPCLGFTKGGTPLYDYTVREPMRGECGNGIGLRGGAYNSGSFGDRGDYFDEMRRIDPAAAAGPDGKPTGRLYWFRGEKTGRWTHRFPEPGVVLFPFMAAGAADLSCGGEVVCWISDFGQRYLFTNDMLYIGQLFQDARTDYSDWPATAQSGFDAAQMAPGQESFNSSFTRTADGRYLLTAGFTGCRVFEVTGLDRMQRINGSVTITPEALPRAQEILAWRQQEKSGGRKTLRIPSLPAAVTEGKPLAALDSTKWAKAVIGKEDAVVRCAYDNRSLYVVWTVKDASPLVNHADRWELSFKGGDAVDLMYRRPGTTPVTHADGQSLQPGDCRLLLTRQADKIVAVLYRPLSKTKAPYLFDAFEGAGRANAVRMDEVRQVDSELQTVVNLTADGYEIRAIIPWTLLGDAPKSADLAALDFGVLAGSPQGGTVIARRYWSNPDTQIVSDIPSEAKLEPKNWTEVTFE